MPRLGCCFLTALSYTYQVPSLMIRYNMYNSFCTIHVFIVIRLVIKLAKIKWAVLLLVFELFVFLTIITTI